MFITLTIDTTQKKNHKLRLHKSNFSVASGWRKAIHAKKRNLWQRALAWKRSLNDGCYRVGGQIAMF